MSRVPDWCFTDFHHLEEKFYDDWYNTGGIQFLICQLEMCPETGTLHIQGYVIFDTRKRLSALKKIDAQRRWSPRQAPLRQQAADYCRKEESRAGWSRTWGLFEELAPGKRSDLVQIKRKLDEGASIEDIMDDHFSDWCRYGRAFREYKRIKSIKRNFKSHVTVYWGPTGTGKSTRVLHETKGNVYIKEGCKDWWDDYDGTQDVLIDEFYGGFRWTYLLNLLDRFPMRVETKGGYVNFAPKRIFITSNRHPSTWYSHEYADVGALMRRIEVCEDTSLRR